MNHQVLLFDNDLNLDRILSRFHCIFSLRDGIFHPLKRIQKKYPNCHIFYYHPDPLYEKCICESHDLFSWHEVYGHSQSEPDTASISKHFEQLFPSSELEILRSLSRLKQKIENDISLWYKKDKLQKPAQISNHLECVGPKEGLLVHKRARLLPGVILDTNAGPIIIDKEAQVSPFSYLKGPLYIAPGAQLDNARLSGACSIGRQVRLGGEIENSIIQDFSNKHHDGFLGHSLVGRWVNLGAMTTSSDLKNNYGEIKVQLPLASIPQRKDDVLQNLSTGSIKFGSIVGDCVKTAIGTMLNTGTVLDAAANIFGGNPPKYVYPFSWGLQGAIYELERFKSDTRTIFKRRQQKMSSSFELLVQRLYAD